jgi:hypothetical protein
MSWSETFLKLLKDNDVRLITYVPDNVLTPLIAGVNADNYFLPVTATREDQASGTVSGAYMARLRGAVMMQTSGFALIANALASLVLPYQIPTVMVISERGTLGEFNIGQSLVARTMRSASRWHSRNAGFTGHQDRRRTGARSDAARSRPHSQSFHERAWHRARRRVGSVANFAFTRSELAVQAPHAGTSSQSAARPL